MRKLMIALAMGAAFLLPLDGYTLGLGEIDVKSALNQELEAEIELLSAVPEDAEALIVKLASREEFNRAGLDRPFLLQDLKFTNVIKNGVPHVKITSSKPIREPFLNFLIEVDWPKGHLLREYTILLDPPIFINEEANSRPAPSGPRPSAPAPANKGATSSGAGLTVVAPVSSMAAKTQAPAATAQAGRATPTAQTSVAPAPTYTTPNPDPDYRVKQGDTAWSLADELRPDQSVSIEQMMLALLRTNPESFIKDNVNGLKRGFILRVPERSEITSVSQADAVAMVRQQNALWREYQQIAGSGSSAAGVAKSGTDKSAASKTKVGDARLSIVSAGKGAATGAVGNLDDMSVADLRAQLALAEERLESERLENENLQGEVSDLEQQVSKMKRLLSIEDESLAQMQATASKSKTTDKPVKPIDTQKAVTTPDKAADTALPPVVATTTDSKTKLTPETTDTEFAETEDVASGDGEQVFVEDDTELAAEAADQEMPVEQVPASDDSLALDYEAPVEPQRGLLVSLFGSPEILAAAGAGMLLLMGLVYMLIKRRRASATAVADTTDFVDDDLADVADMLEDSALDQTASDEDVAASMAAAEAEAEDFDSDATTILPAAGDTVITEASDEEARDDVIAEADVYLAYGIYQQAEELLQNAIKENPDNDAYRMKLAETYFAGKNATGFEALATEMHKRTQGKGGRWQKLAAMGKDLLPGNDLFKGAAAGVALDDLVPAPEPMDFDLGLDDETSASTDTDMDFSLDDDALELPDTSPAASPAADDELEFDLSETDAVKAEEDFSLDFAAAELDLATEDAKPEADAAMDFDLELDTGGSATDTAETTSEDDEIDFDIDVSEELEASATVTTTADSGDADSGDADSGDADSDDGVVDLSDLDDVDEVSTKLDLARAYLDMGDNEGTRSILEEVIEEGNAAQKSEAEALLAEIAG